MRMRGAAGRAHERRRPRARGAAITSRSSPATRPSASPTARSSVPRRRRRGSPITSAKPNSRLERVDQVEHPRAGVGVEVAGRLVAQQQRRPLRKRARDRDTLRLAAGQLGRQRVELGREPDEREQLGRSERVAVPSPTS